MSKDKETPICDVCAGSGKRSEPETSIDPTNKFTTMCPYCSGTGQTLKLDTAAMAALSFSAKKR